MFVRACCGAGLIAAALCWAPVAPRAQDAPALPAAAPNPADDALAPAGPPLDAAESESLSRALVFDAAQFATNGPTAALRVPGLPQPHDLDVTSKDNSDGGGTVNLKQPLPGDWDAKFGADLNVSAPPAVTYQPDGQLPASQNMANSTAAAWASVGLIDNATLDARLDAGNDHSQVATTLQQSVPFGSDYSLTLRERLALNENASAVDPAPAGLPVMALPQAATAPERVWTNQPDVRFNILPTGTTLSAGVASSSTDPVLHNSLSADQQLYGPLHVTTSVTDIGQATVSKSVKAAFMLTW